MDEIRQKSWASRNWGWLLGGGCLTLIIIGVIGVITLVYKVSDTITESETYIYAYTNAAKNEKVIDFLGEPIETDGIGSSSYKYVNGSSTAKLTIPIKGPKDEGEIVVDAEKINNEWTYHQLYVKIDGETETINLLETEEEDSNDDLDNF
ncbi:cytochrome c oxidase assembly factor Coa1 family protein [Lacinutrix chionoecetis]